MQAVGKRPLFNDPVCRILRGAHYFVNVADIVINTFAAWLIGVLVLAIPAYRGITVLENNHSPAVEDFQIDFFN